MIHSPNSSAFEIVAESATTLTEGGRWIRTSSHTAPRYGVLQVVHLVHHDGVQARECGRSLVQHVAEDLGGHDDDGRLRIDRVVAREETDRPRTVLGDEIAELLVRQGLQRGRVEGLGAAVESALDGELRDDGLP